MSIANRIRSYLDTHDVSYEVLPHPPSRCSTETADLAYIWKDQLAKTVLLEDERGHLLAVVPASRRLDFKKLNAKLHRNLHLATESELADLFPDCEAGAVPPLGHAYGIPIIYDEELTKLSCVYFEGGDHRELVYMGGPEFIELLSGSGSAHGDYCRRN